MLKEAILAYLHFAAIFTLVWFLAKEWTLLRAGPEAIDFRRLSLADAGYGLSSLAVLATGLARFFIGAKPAVFYLHNPVFYVKIGLFVLVGLASIAPTIRIARWRRAAAENAAFRPDMASWRGVRRWVMIEAHILALIPLAAVLMSRAIGYIP